MFELTRLITMFFYWIKERNKDKNNSSKSQERESLSVSRKEPPLEYPYLGLSTYKISLSLDESTIKYQLMAEGEKIVGQR